MRVKFLCMKLLAPLDDDPSAFCGLNLGGKCAQTGMERDRSALMENTIHLTCTSLDIQTRIFLVEWNVTVCLT